MAEAQKARVGRVLEQPPHEVSHAGEEIADRRVEPDAMTEFAQEIALRLGHAEKHLDLVRARLESEMIRVGERGGNGAKIVRAEGGLQRGMMIKHMPGEALEIGVGVVLAR